MVAIVVSLAGSPAGLRQLVVPVEQELEDEDAERDAGDLEEAPEVDAQAAAHEQHAEGDRDREADAARRAPPSGRWW